MLAMDRFSEHSAPGRLAINLSDELLLVKKIKM
jgi:hypothetical protein